jgi:predicted nucleic acid-binding protein
MRQDQTRHERTQLKLNVAEEDEHRMAEWHRLYLEDVAGEEVFWAEKKAARRERRRLRREKRARKRYLKVELDNPNSTLDINENSLEWDNLRLTSEESSAPGSINNG